MILKGIHNFEITFNCIEKANIIVKILNLEVKMEKVKKVIVETGNRLNWISPFKYDKSKHMRTSYT